MVPTQGGSVLYVCTKVEADSSFRSKVIRRSQNFEIGSRDPGHTHLGAHLGVILYSLYRRGPPSLIKFEADCTIRSKVIKRVPKLGN